MLAFHKIGIANDAKEDEERLSFKERCALCLKGPKQIIRSIVLFTCLIVVICQIVTCLRKIKNPPISTYTHFDFNETIMYPAVTVCRDPPYKADILAKHGLYGHPRFTSEWKHFNFDTVNLNDFWDEATYSKEDNFMSYGLNSSSDNIEITNHLHFILGKCQTILPKIAVSTASKNTGYSILLNHSLMTVDSTPSAIPPGYHVYIHQIDEPFAELSSISLMDYLYVNLGEELEVKLTVQELNMLPNGPKPCHNTHNYSSTRCSEECTWNKLIEEVGCSGPWIEKNVSHCDNYKDMRHLIVNYIRLSNEPGCACPQKCRSFLHSAFVMDRNSVTRWNSQTGEWIEKNGLEKVQTQLYIYFNNKMVSVYEESHSYDWSLLLSDFGGSLGFLLGLSVLGFIAILEDIFEMVIKPFLPGTKRSISKQDVNIEKSNCNKKISVASSNSSSGTNYNDKSDILKDYEKFNIKYGDKQFYM